MNLFFVFYLNITTDKRERFRNKKILVTDPPSGKFGIYVDQLFLKTENQVFV